MAGIGPLYGRLDCPVVPEVNEHRTVDGSYIYVCSEEAKPKSIVRREDLCMYLSYKDIAFGSFCPVYVLDAK